MSAQKITLTAEVVMLAGHVATVIAAARRCADATHQEPGCELYILTTLRDRPNVILFLEVFKTQADFETHGNAPHTQAFLAGLKGRVEGDAPRLTFLDQVSLATA